uniref:Uncharacterized protein n=1 Tax=Globodera rostochiensis TaxID=31243 RepID=A0A914HN55_GLORO
MINIYPIYSIKMTFVSILILAALTLEVQCQNSTSDRFNAFILAITSANSDKQSIIISDQQFVDQHPVDLELTKARQLQEWIGQLAKQIVDEHGIEASNYTCKPNVNFNDVIFDDVILTIGQSQQQIKLENYLKKKKQEKKPFLKLLFSFGASLSAEIGGPPHHNENNYLRSLLTAYGCIEGQLVAVEKSGSNFGIREYINIGESMYTFDIENVIERPLCKLITQKVILKMPSENDNHKPRHIQSFSLLNALNVQLTALDVIQFAEFIGRFIQYYFSFPYNFYEKINNQIIIDASRWLQYYEHQSEQCVKKEEINVRPAKNAKASENANLFAHYDNAIRIDWNIWNVVKQRVDELIEATIHMPTVENFGGKLKKNDEEEKFVFDLDGANKLLDKLYEFAIKKIAFLAVSKCFIVRPEWANKLSIFDLWMEIKMVVLKKNQNSVTGIEIYKNIKQKDVARQISQDNYKMLKLLNEQQFSIYECQLARLSQNIMANLLEMPKEKNMKTELKKNFDNWKIEVQTRNNQFIEEKCETAKRDKIELLISVRYDLVVNFVHNLSKDILGLKGTNEHIVEAKAKLDEARHHLIEHINEKIESLETKVEVIKKRQLKDNKLPPPADEAHKSKHLFKETKTKLKKLFRSDERKLMEINQKLTKAKAMLTEMAPGEAQSSSSSPAGKMGEEVDKLQQIIHETESIQAELDTMLNSYNNTESVQNKLKSSNEQKVQETLAKAIKENEETIKSLKASVKMDIGKANSGMKSIKKMLEDIKSDYGKRIDDASLVGYL